MSTRTEYPPFNGNVGKFLRVNATETNAEWQSAVPGTGVATVTGLNTDNTDPVNPIVKISVDGTTITGLGTPGSPLVASPTNTGVQSVTDDGNGIINVDNTDPENPIIGIDTVALATDTTFVTTLSSDTSFVTSLESSLDLSNIGGSIDLTTQVTGILPLDKGGTGSSLTDPGSDGIMGYDNTDNEVKFFSIGSGLSYDQGTNTLSSTGATAIVESVTGTYIDNTDPVNPVSIVPLNNTTTTAPTVSDDETLGYAIDSQWFDSNTGTLYTCEDATTGAAVWTGIGGSGSVNSVTGTYIDNTDPINPVSIVPLNNTTTTAPTVSDDDTLGYAIDSKWFDSVTGILYTCEDATTGAAVWTAISGSGSGNNKIAIDTTQQTFATVSGAAATQALYTVAIPGNTLGTNNSIRFKLINPRASLGTGTSTMSFSATYGGQTIFTNAICYSVSGSGGITDRPAIWDAYITANAATGSQKNNIDYTQYQFAPGNPFSLDFLTILTTTTVDSTVSQNLVVSATIQSSSGAGNTFTSEGIIVELIS